MQLTSFDKSKKMRNAERYLTQGKISAAIEEYELILKNNPNDVNVQNILGDLFNKVGNVEAAVKFYSKAAKHYDSRGFSKKAIAVYKKINRLKPNSPEILINLAELYKKIRFLKDALHHYEELAKYHEERNNPKEAFSIWKKIIEIGSDNPDIYVKMGDFYYQNRKYDHAMEVYVNGASQFLARDKLKEALAAYSKVLKVKPTHLTSLKGYAKTQIKRGYPEKAAETLRKTLDSNPSNKKDIFFLLVDCYLEIEDLAEAESLLLNQLKNDSTQCSKFFDLVNYYLNKNDLNSAVRILSMITQQVLTSNKPERIIDTLNEILMRDPENIAALKLQLRYHSWYKENFEIEDTLRRIAEVSKLNEAVEDERFALSQLVITNPGDLRISNRLKELNNPQDTETLSESDKATQMKGYLEPSAEQSKIEDETYIADQIDGIKFYIDQGYINLAKQTLKELRSQYGDRDEFSRIQMILEDSQEQAANYVQVDASDIQVVEGSPKNTPEIHASESFTSVVESSSSEMALSEASPPNSKNETDYETHYHHAVAYQEMGLLDDAIREFQMAVDLTDPSDGMEKFLKCCTLLGHCFVEKRMPKLAATWFNRAFKIKDLGKEEKMALHYELANVYELKGDEEKACEQLEQIYAIDISYRDVGKRLAKYTK